MARTVHLVGSIGLDTVGEVFATVGEQLGPHLRRVPDGEPGGRRLWISWQYPLLRANPFLKPVPRPPGEGESDTGFLPLGLTDGVSAGDVRFGELGYAREARASYVDFCRARERGELPPGVRFQVSLPTPFAVISPFCAPEARAVVEPAYEQAMLREVEAITAEIPHRDLAIQWDVCIEMVMWDGRWRIKPFPGMAEAFTVRFARLAAAVPADVELGYHLCYGDWEAKHFIEPLDAAKMVELANLLFAASGRSVNFIHMPVPVGRDDDAFFAPMKDLRLPRGTELYLGLVHPADAEGTRRRIAAAARHAPDFGVATECGFARSRTPSFVREILDAHAAALTD
jgi:hypothetical protein